ncbi:MAG: Fic family protein [Bacteroidota bacterium]|nr:Fic family protein [Bacteroidota bacterium]
MMKYIYEYPTWPNFTWDEGRIQLLLGQVRHLQGKVLGQMSAMGFKVKAEALLATLTLDVIKSSEIEGENLDYDQVRSSIARRLGIEIGGMVYSGRDVEGVVEMLLDATQNFETPIDHERLYGWHAALFPSGRSGMYKIDVAKYRTGEMVIVSGPMGKEKIHYQAPKPGLVLKEMDQFIGWFNANNHVDPVLKAAIAHFWFIIIHPFDDGNGRIARAISDLMLAKSDGSRQRFYSLSSQILKERKSYYETLQKVQYSNGDITDWLEWFMNCLYRSLQSSDESMHQVLRKADFWDKHSLTELNSRQRLILNKLFDGFEGKLKSSKWAKIAKCSTDTALRDIKDLIEKGILRQEESGGRNTNYELEEF